jgi:NAD(P)-dependent dehydrogenase (short-subunit alcohol dehydrogenase family)
MDRKVWLITGCSTGLGRAIAIQALESGYYVAVAARKTTDVEDLEEKYPNAFAVKLDVTDQEQIRAAVATVTKKYGTLDVLVNNAGIGYFAAIEESEDEAVRRMFEINFFGLANMTREVLPIFRAKKSGHIINIASVGGLIAYPAIGFYHATKFAVDGYSESLNKEVSPLGIKVTIVAPSGFRTEWAGSNASGSNISIADYEETAHKFKAAYIAAYGKQAGDPVRAGKAIVKIVEDAHPPLRLLLGVEALQEARKKLTELKTDFDNWEDTTTGADFPKEELEKANR